MGVTQVAATGRVEVPLGFALPEVGPLSSSTLPPAVVAEVARTVVDADKVITRSKPKMGSEDFADMMQVVPGAYFWVGHDGSVPVHNPGYVLDDKILPIGASMFARIIETRLPVGSHA